MGVTCLMVWLPSLSVFLLLAVFPGLTFQKTLAQIPLAQAASGSTQSTQSVRAVRPWTSGFNPQGSSFLICEMGIMLPEPQGRCYKQEA